MAIYNCGPYGQLKFSGRTIQILHTEIGDGMIFPIIKSSLFEVRDNPQIPYPKGKQTIHNTWVTGNPNKDSRDLHELSSKTAPPAEGTIAPKIIVEVMD